MPLRLKGKRRNRRRHCEARTELELKKLAERGVKMVGPGDDAEVMKRYPASKKGLEGVSVRLD